MRLSHADFDVLQRTILVLYEYRDEATFWREVPETFLRVIPADAFVSAGYNIEPANRTAKLVHLVESDGRCAGITPWMERLVFKHPFTQYFLTGGEPTALKLSDFLSTIQFRNSELHQNAYGAVEVERELSAPIRCRRGSAAVSFCRRGRDFTERDRLMLNLLQPHFNQALRNAELTTARMEVRAKPLAEYDLSPREAGIAHWVGEGKSNPEIAIILKISPRTVEKHMERILGKLGAENRTTAAVLIASGKGAH